MFIKIRLFKSWMDKSKKLQKIKAKKTLKIGLLLVLPYIIYNLVFWVYPTAFAFPLALFKWDIISPSQFIGLQNFMEFWSSEEFRAIMWNAVRFMLIYVPFSMGVALVLALLFRAVQSIQLRAVFATVAILPHMSSPVAYSIIFYHILSPRGFLTLGLRNLGLNPKWFSDPWWVIVTFVMIIAWKSSGYYALLFLAGLNSISQDVYEAAMLDSANWWTRFWQISIPLLNPALVVVMILSVQTFFIIFSEPFLLTGGGPMLASNTFSLEAFNQLYNNLKVGYSAAISITQGLTTFVFIVILKKVIQREI